MAGKVVVDVAPRLVGLAGATVVVVEGTVVTKDEVVLVTVGATTPELGTPDVVVLRLLPPPLRPPGNTGPEGAALAVL